MFGRVMSNASTAVTPYDMSAMDLQQIGLRHPVAELVRDIRGNRTGIPRRTFVAEGLFENNIVLESGVPVEVFLWCPEAAYSDEAAKRAGQLAGRARRSYQISARTLGHLAERPNPDGLLTVAQLPDWRPDEIAFGRDALVLVTDALEIPGNLGTLIRTLDACSADCLVMTNRRTRLTHPKVLRSSQGMSMTVPSVEFGEVDEAIAWLRRHRFTVYLADTDQSVNYRRCDYRGRTALVVGSERYGVSQPWYDAGFQRVGIPMLGSADSLNVSVSASVLLYEARAQKAGW
jgi:TrmH family RNA methyltransferase